jgi:hypothetical protein
MWKMFTSVRSLIVSFKASAALGRASRLREKGHIGEALTEARWGLALLSAPHIARLNPPEGSALLTLTMLVEQLAFEVGELGASPDDLRDSLAFLGLMGENPTPNVAEQMAWVHYLESRLAQHT